MHAQAQGLEPLEKHPGIERAHARSGTAHEAKHFAPDELAIADHRAADAATLTIEILGCGVNHEVRAELERLLQRGGAKAVVDCEQTSGLTRNRGDGADVSDSREGI